MPSVGGRELTIVPPGGLALAIKNESVGKVAAWDAARARSKQTGIGASQIGCPCTKQLLYAARGVEKRKQVSDPWAAIVGSACHSGPLHEAFRGSPDWLLDHKMEIGPGLYGTLDRYHIPTGCVVDDKVLGVEALKKMRKHGPGPQYRTQVHMYGFGMSRLGHDVRHVALCCWPRSGRMVDAYVWTEPYSDDVVETAFQRWYGLLEAAPAFTPEMFALVAKADGPCGWCPYYDPELEKSNPELACGGI